MVTTTTAAVSVRDRPGECRIGSAMKASFL
jgi:hypothetical protein